MAGVCVCGAKTRGEERHLCGYREAVFHAGQTFQWGCFAHVGNPSLGLYK